MWQIEQVADTVARLRVDWKRNRNWRFKILVTADRHIDSKYSKLKLQKKHLKEAQENGWPVVDLGDVMDAMQGAKDPRGCRSELIPFLFEKNEYFDAVVDFAGDFLTPYARSLALIGKGNHETSALRHNGTDLTSRLVKRLSQSGSPVIMGGYAGWIRLQFTSGKTQQSVNIRYMHGSGGGAPVTKGVIKTNRRAVVYPDAHIVLSGHTHDAYSVPLARERISESCNVFADCQLHVQVMSYKSATVGQGVGWEVEKEFATQPVGAYWLDFWYDRACDRVRYDARRAM